MASINAYEQGLRDPVVAQRRAKYYPLVQQASAKYGIPVALLDGVLMNESRYDPKAKGPTNDLGIAQFIPSTAKRMGVIREDSASSIDGAARLLREGLAKGNGDWSRAAQYYNSGRSSGAPISSVVASYMKYANDLRAKYGDGKSAPVPAYTGGNANRDTGYTEGNANGYAAAVNGANSVAEYKPPVNPAISNLQSGIIAADKNADAWGTYTPPSHAIEAIKPNTQALAALTKQWSTW